MSASDDELLSAGPAFIALPEAPELYNGLSARVSLHEFAVCVDRKRNARPYSVLLRYIARIGDFRRQCQRWMQEATAHALLDSMSILPDELERSGLVLGDERVPFQWRGHAFLVRKLRLSGDGVAMQPAGGSAVLEIVVARQDKDALLCLMDEAALFDYEAVRNCIRVLKPSRFGSWTISGTIALAEANRVADVYEDDAAKLMRLCRAQYHKGGSGGLLRGILLKGRPGTGKSMWILLAALSCRVNLCWLDLSSPRVSNESLVQLLARIPPRSLLVLEDADDAPCTNVGVGLRDAAGGGGMMGGSCVTLQALLLAMDGLKGPSDLVWVVTTNAASVLDPALTRCERISHTLEFTYATGHAVHRMFRHVFHKADGALARRVVGWYEESRPSMTLAELHQLFVDAGHARGSASDRLRAIKEGITDAQRRRAAEEEEEREEENGADDRVTAWLARHGASRYAAAFEHHRIGLHDVPDLSHALLKEIGVLDEGVCEALMRARRDAVAEPLGD